MQHAPTAEPPEPLQRRITLVERRRNGRSDYKNPALIELLRHPTAGPPAADAIAAADHVEPPRDPVHQGERRFAITDFDSLRPRPGDPREALRQSVGLHPQPVEIAFARAERYCRDDCYGLEWTELLATEVAKIRSFITGNDYPRDTPTGASITALIANLVSLSRFVRRVCLVSGRDGTPQANRAAAQAICSLGSWTQAPGEYSYWSALRALCASLCFYWAVAGAIARHDFATVRAFMHTRITKNGSEEALVSALPLLALGSIEWKVLKGLEERQMPASDFLFSLFKPEVADAALDPGEAAEDLFDRLEFLISLEFSHMRLQQIAASSRPLWFWMPLGRYVGNLSGERILDRFAALENLPADHALLQAGLLGGTPASAADAAQAMRQILDTSRRCAASRSA